MNKRIAFLLVVFSLLFSCTGNRKKTQDKVELPVAAGERQAEAVTPDASGFVPVGIMDGYGVVTVRKKKNEKVYIEFDPDGYGKLEGTLKSGDPAANVRFTQIFMPDGSADGPFGREISYDLVQNGKYRLSIGENMMAGDPWEGTFTIEIKIDN